MSNISVTVQNYYNFLF